LVEPPSAERRHVLHDDVSGSKFANKPGVLGPKTRAGAGESGAAASEADVLAREAAAEDIDSRDAPPLELCDIGVAGHAWPVLGEHPAAELALLALPEDVHTGALEAEVEASDPGEEGADGEHVT
jgi:hypothetical protein